MAANNLVINSLFVLFGVNEISSTFVSVGEYPDCQRFGINLPTCGLQRVPEVHEISFNKKCFKNSYQTIRVLKTFDSLHKRENDSNVAKRILNGQNVEPGESPWTVSIILYMHDKWKGVSFRTCSGVLITLNWLLTAAHCLDMNKNITSYWIQVKAGLHEMRGQQSILGTNQSVFKHPGYPNRYDERDVALIKLNNSFEQFDNRYVRYLFNPICIPETGQINFREETAHSYGFGFIKPNEYPNYLQKMEVILKPFHECNDFFCANMSGNQSRTCAGDSGGPLLQFLGNNKEKAVLIGIYEGKLHPIHITPVPCGPGPEINRWIAVPRVINWILGTIRSN